MINKKCLKISAVASLLIATNLLSNDNLQEITVTSATKSEQSIKDVTSNINVITKEDIEERHFTTVSEAINSIAGINVVSNGGLGKSTSVFMRGFDSQRILVLIDGIRYNDFTGISGARFEHLMISDIKQIEVIKGAQSGIWGADANAGVINIITNDAEPGTNGEIIVEGGSFNTKKLNAKISHKTEKYDIKLALTKLNSDAFTSRAKKGEDIDKFEDDGYRNTTVNIKAGYNFDENNRVEVIHNRIDAISEYDTGGAITDAKANAEGYELKTHDQFTSANFTSKQNFADFKAYVNHTSIDRDDDKGFTKNFDGTLEEYGLNAKIPYKNDSFVLVGVDYKDTNHKNDTKRTLINKGAFITNSTKFEKLVFTQSLRHDKYDLFNDKTTGKIGAKYNINEDLWLSSNYGTSYNVPTFYKLYNGFAGFANLQPESTKSFDLTLNYKNFNLTYFNNKIDNMIEYNSSTFKYYNMDGTVRLKGLELGYKQQILEDLLLSLNYTYTDAKDHKDKDLQRRAKNSVKFAFDYYGFNDLHLNLNGEYIGKRIQYDFGTYKESASTGNYTLWNAVANYKVNDKVSTYLKVDNIFDKHYQTVDSYATAPLSAYVGVKVKF